MKGMLLYYINSNTYLERRGGNPVLIRKIIIFLLEITSLRVSEKLLNLARKKPSYQHGVDVTIV